MADYTELIDTLKSRFEKNMPRHPQKTWPEVAKKIEKNPSLLSVLLEMETTGGEPDVADIGVEKDIIFVDCAKESPAGRRSFCYDEKALEARKQNKPADSALAVAKKMKIDILDEQQYHKLQEFGAVDTKTSSWLKTPVEIRGFGGAIFGDYRYGQVFIYHNSADSYYAARGFRGFIKV